MATYAMTLDEARDKFESSATTDNAALLRTVAQEYFDDGIISLPTYEYLIQTTKRLA